jgi:hypothetical protein
LSSSLPVLLMASKWVDDPERLVTEEATFVAEEAWDFLDMRRNGG